MYLISCLLSLIFILYSQIKADGKLSVGGFGIALMLSAGGYLTLLLIGAILYSDFILRKK